MTTGEPSRGTAKAGGSGGVKQATTHQLSKRRAVILSAVFRPAKRGRKQEKDLCIPRHPPYNLCSNPQWKGIGKSAGGLGAAIVWNAWVLRREPFAQRRTPLPQDDSGERFKLATTGLGSS